MGGTEVKPTSEMSPAELAEYFGKHFGRLVIGVLREVRRNPGFKGKTNLGRAVGAKGSNERCNRPVEYAERLGLISGFSMGRAYVYRITQKGEVVLDALDGR